jgi:hypothetical protein
VDDVSYGTEPAFQDGIVAQAVNTVTASGALYFSSAGNQGNKDDGTSGVWEGDFADSGVTLTTPKGTGHVHNFGGGTISDLITSPGPWISLQWSDAWGASANDYDLFLLDPFLSYVVGSSTDVQNGSGTPFEGIIVGAFDDTFYQLVIVRSSGAARFLRLSNYRGQLVVNTAGQTWGHNSAVDAISVAAVTAHGLTSPFVGGASNPVETYSSDGPRRVFYLADGTPITPGNFSSTGGAVRQKPDIAAADCVMMSTSGFNPFCGTSAAAPHAAAIAALVKSTNPALTTAQIRTALTSTALDIEAPGGDRDSGAGLLNAFAAVQSMLVVTPTRTPTLTPTSTATVTDTPTNTATRTPTQTPTATPSGTPTKTPTQMPPLTPTTTASATDTPTNTAASTPTQTPTATPSDTPTKTPTQTPPLTPTTTASATDTPTNTATNTPTQTPTATPTRAATPPCRLDVDLSGPPPDVATDAVYIARTLLGLVPVPASFRALNPNIPPDAEIAARVQAMGNDLNVDGKGTVDVATDIVYIARHLLSLPPVPPSFRALDPSIPSDAGINANIDALCPQGSAP